MTDTQRDFIKGALARLILTIANKVIPPGESRDIVEPIQSLASQFLGDVNRIADALERPTGAPETFPNSPNVTRKQDDEYLTRWLREELSSEPVNDETPGQHARRVILSLSGYKPDPRFTQAFDDMINLVKWIERDVPNEPQNAFPESVGQCAIRIITDLSAQLREARASKPAGSADDFAAWLTTIPIVIEVGASTPTTDIFTALAKYKEIKTGA